MFDNDEDDWGFGLNMVMLADDEPLFTLLALLSITFNEDADDGLNSRSRSNGRIKHAHKLKTNRYIYIKKYRKEIIRDYYFF